MRRIYSVLAGLASVGILAAYSFIFMGDIRDRVEAEIQLETEYGLVYDDMVINSWEDGEKVYLFLPSCFVWEETEFVVSEGKLFLNDGAVETGTSLTSFDKEAVYSYCWISEEGQEKCGELQFLQSADVASVFIETESSSMEQIHQDKAYREGGTLVIRDAKGEPSYSGRLSSMGGRGNATWKSEKKSYRIKLAQEADLLQMGAAENWILLSNVYDGSKLQNKLCLDMAREIGLAYSPEAEWVDLYLNGSYHGNYLLCEKVEVGENRVDIQDGYLIERDFYYDEPARFRTDDGNPFSIKHPQNATEEQIEYIADYVQGIEKLILEDKVEEADQYLDWESFILRYLLDEAVLNQDTGVTSMYFYKDGEGGQTLFGTGLGL